MFCFLCFSLFFFFLMIRRPPRSTLFPYTRSSDLASENRYLFSSRTSSSRVPHLASPEPKRVEAGARSEEHTSELQSHSDLVCRLLLEKKKKKKKDTMIQQAKQRKVEQHTSRISRR